MQDGAGGVPPFGPAFLWDRSGHQAEEEVATFTLGFTPTEDEYARLIFSMSLKHHVTATGAHPYLDYGVIANLNKVPLYLLHSLHSLLEEHVQETMGEIGEVNYK